MEAYNKIPCGVYDQFEIVAMRRTPVTVRYRNKQHQEFVIDTKIVDLKSKDKVEYAILESGETIRLDWILQLNDLVVQDATGCYL